MYAEYILWRYEGSSLQYSFLFFKYDYEDDWITDPFVKEMIRDVDQSIVLDSGVIDSPVLGKNPPTGLSGGVKTLILVKFDKDKIFNASTCGDNCAKWLLKIAEKEDRTINLHHLMRFGTEPFTIHVLNQCHLVKLIGSSQFSPMLKMIWKVCGWEENQTYRSDGVCYKEHCLVEFDLEQAEIWSFVET